jgi:hypothetical protein
VFQTSIAEMTVRDGEPLSIRAVCVSSFETCRSFYGRSKSAFRD